MSGTVGILQQHVAARPIEDDMVGAPIRPGIAVRLEIDDLHAAGPTLLPTAGTAVLISACDTTCFEPSIVWIFPLTSAGLRGGWDVHRGEPLRGGLCPPVGSQPGDRDAENGTARQELSPGDPNACRVFHIGVVQAFRPAWDAALSVRRRQA